MCLGDWRLANLMRQNATFFLAGFNAPGSQIVAANPNRVHFHVGMDLQAGLVGQITGHPYGVPNLFVLADTGATPTVPYFDFTLARHGPLVQQAWNFLSFTGQTVQISVIETFLPQEVIGAFTEELRRHIFGDSPPLDNSYIGQLNGNPPPEVAAERSRLPTATGR